jgi:diguanylate cyclase (GGDEF)-like protein
VRASVSDVLESWGKHRRGTVEREHFDHLREGMGRLIEVFADFLASPDSVDTFSRGGAVRALVDRIAAEQHAAGRDAVGVIEDFAVLRRCLWKSVEEKVDLSALDGGEVAWFFGKLMLASDWITEAGSQAYAAIERREMEEALGRAAATDLLTGLPDRDLFSRLLLPRAVDEWGRFAVAVFDVAGFSERVATGKVKRARKILRRLAEIVEGAAGEDAVCARFGDDEICVLLPDAGSEGGYRLAERVVERLEQDAEDFQVDVGVAEYPAHGEEPGALMVETLKALKMAKRVGGSGIVVAHYDKERS